ncbi:MAG: MFS transporter [Deltaproteobacteria bacterium]|nr:MFS transporter [Deltaproteobacteria bacterium]
MLALQATFGASLACYLLLPKYLVTEFGAAATEIGGVMATFSLANIVVVAPVGIGVDRFGRRPLIQLGLAILSLSSLGFLFVDSVVPELYGLRALQGISFACVYISASTLVTDTAPPERLSQALALSGATIHLMNAVVPWLAEQASESLGWQSVFAASLVLGLVSLGVSMTLRDRVSTRDETVEAPSLLSLLARRSFLISLFVMAAAGVANATLTTFIQPHALARGILRVAAFFTAFAVAAVSVRVLLGGFMDRANRYVICLVSLACYAALLLATRDVTGTTLPLLGGLLGIVHGFFVPSFLALNLAGASDGERGRIVALLSGSFNVGFAFGTLGVGAVSAAHGYGAGFVAAAGVVAVAAGVMLVRPGAARWRATSLS